jgi:putative transposase
MNSEMKTYPCDLSDSEWQLIIPHLPQTGLVGRPRTYDWRSLINGMLYVLRTGCQWRYVPERYASWQAVYRAFVKLGREAFWQRLNQWLSIEIRLEAGREARPSAAVIDSQTVKSSPTASYHGYDAGKKTKGSKRHILVDTLGLLIAVVVHSASLVDCKGAKLVFEQAATTEQGRELEVIWGDGGYDRICGYEAANSYDWRLEVLERPAGSKSFVVIKKRWVVERTFSWLVANRRLARDYERKAAPSEAFIYLAMCRLMLKRLTK